MIIYLGLPKAQREVFSKQSGNSQQLVDWLLLEVDRLSKELDAKDAALHEAQADLKAEIEKWVKKYEELKIKIAKLPENSEQATKANAALIEGDLKKAESAVTISGCTLQGVSIN
jgi:chromosome segregation ATPase